MRRVDEVFYLQTIGCNKDGTTGVRTIDQSMDVALQALFCLLTRFGSRKLSDLADDPLLRSMQGSITQ